MANRLKMANVQSLYLLHAQGFSRREIARKLRISRGTVARHLGQGVPPDSNRAIAPINPGRVPPAPNGAIAPTGPSPLLTPEESAQPFAEPASVGRVSRAAPWRDFIIDKHAQGLSAKRIHQDLMEQAGVGPISYDSVRRLLKRQGRLQDLPFRRMECEPGQEAQVDFGQGAPVVNSDGKRRRTWVFRIVLSHSRKAYSEVTFTQTTEDFFRCLENAFVYFGGVPKTLVIDNLKAAVIHPDWFDPVLTPKVQASCQHYGTVILPTKPYTPRHKGKVESGVKYVKNNALKGRVFTSLEAQCKFLLEWERTIADTRIHGTTKRQVKLLFEQEQPALQKTPLERFACFHEARRKVNRDGHVEVAKAYYSAPPEYLGREVWARWDARLVRLFNHRFEQIALHARVNPGKFSTQGEHLHPRKISGLERGAEYLLNKLTAVGPRTRE